MERRCGLGEEFPLPVTSQFFGNVPDPEWKLRKFGSEWQAFDTVNSTIGQGYMLASQLQLAVAASRIARRRPVMPRTLLEGKMTPGFAHSNFAPCIDNLITRDMHG